MKKFYTIIVVLIINSMIGLAQPVLNESDFNTNFNLDVYAGEAAGLSPGGSGANQTWDFSEITNLEKIGTMTNVPVSSAPFYTDFPQATYCVKYIFSTFFGDIPNYTFVNKSASSFIILGDSDTESSEPYTDPITFFTFPYNYNTVINDTYYDPDYDEQPVAFTSTYDAYGTLKTPYGTYTNVIRQKVEDEVDGVSYSWYHVNPFYFIMEAGFPDENDTLGYVSIYKNASLGTNNNDIEKAIVLYPNPTNSLVNLQIPNNLTIDRIQISDLSGKIVFDENLNNNQVNVQKFSSGLYFINVFSGTNIFQLKFIKE